MNEFLLPYLLITAHFISGAIWLIQINRKLGPVDSKMQWIKFITYVILFNLIWYSVIGLNWLFIILGYALMIIGSREWWIAIKRIRHKEWLNLGFLLVLTGFWSFLHLSKKEILFTIFIVVLFDGSSQIAGQLLGKHLLFQRISPRKTVEGLLGGTLITMGTTLFTGRTFSMQWPELILMSCFIILTAFTGDIIASIIKRKADLTTFGWILPGHGGVLDRYDSLIMAGSAMSLLGLVRNLFP